METLTRPKPEDVLKSTGVINRLDAENFGKFKDSRENKPNLPTVNQSNETEDDVLIKGIESFTIAKNEAEKTGDSKKAVNFQRLIDSYQEMLSEGKKAA